MPNIRKLLYPFSVLYDAVTGSRNVLYDQNILKSKSYDFPVICVGNLNTGGTGKSPMVEYLLKILKENYKIATLSRGYKRKSKGFRIVEENDSPQLTGDEPLQFKKKYPETIVAVDANRQEGIARLIEFSPDIIILDDAFQHRRVEAGFNILLTAYGDLYIDDLILPGGNLRESAAGASRADVILVTKCPEDLSDSEMLQIKKRLQTTAGQKVFFTSIRYADKIYSEKNSCTLDELTEDKITLVTGIANPKPLLRYLKMSRLNFEHVSFPDHHNFSDKEIKGFQSLSVILTTEKDYMRLKGKISSEKLFYLPIQVNFLNSEEEFKSTVLKFLHKK